MFMVSEELFCKKGISRVKEFICYFLYYILNSVTFLTLDNRTLTLMSNILPFFFITLMYSTPFGKRIMLILFINAVAMSCDMLTTTFQNMLGISSVFFSEGFVSYILFILATKIISEFISVKKQPDMDLPIMYYITIIFIPIASIAIGYFAAGEFNWGSLIVAVIVILINTDIYYLYDKLVRMFSERSEKELIENQNAAYLNQLKMMQESQLAVRCLKHDMDNHILKMQNLLANREYAELTEYLSQTKKYVDFEQNTVVSGNDSVDSVVNYKLGRIKSLNVETKFNLSVPEKIEISSFDMNIVIGNLLDNAIEALERLPKYEDKKLSVTIRYEKGYLKLIIVNTFDGIIAQNGATTKGDSKNHGLGLKSVNMIAEKYGGLLKTEISDNQFKTSVIMYEK